LSAVVSAHPRISVNSLSSLYQTLQQDISMWQELGIDHVGLISPKLEAAGWDAAYDLITRAGLKVSNISTEQHVIAESLRLAGALGAGTVYICSGPGGSRTWEDAAGAFRDEIAPLAALATEVGVMLGLEPTNPLRSDVSFVFCLRDAVDLARASGIGVVVDVYSCWYERGFEELVTKNIDLIGLVQVCDYSFGTFSTPNRAVPGDGDIPLRRILSEVLNAGYHGAFDLEILGPKIEDEGYASAVRRSLDRTSDLLAALGVPG
jgi:sugar phosphate isomerase/epimerase